MLVFADDTFDDLDDLFMGQPGPNVPQPTKISESDFADLDTLFNPTTPNPPHAKRNVRGIRM